MSVIAVIDRYEIESPDKCPLIVKARYQWAASDWLDIGRVERKKRKLLPFGNKQVLEITALCSGEQADGCRFKYWVNNRGPGF